MTDHAEAQAQIAAVLSGESEGCVIHGDCLEILPLIPAGSVDAVVTDPPYSSGGQFRGDRSAKAVNKYVQSEQAIYRPDFGGDSRDQRSFLAWCSLWLLAAKTATNHGGVCICFSDWRQIPVMTDAIQCAGWLWRNLGTWWKPGCRMQRGRFSGSAEYIVYATNGPHTPTDEGSPQNVISCQPVSGDDKSHLAEKPIEVMNWCLSATRPGVILDPFCGSGTTLVAAKKLGRRYIGIELDERYCQIARNRLASTERPLFQEASNGR